VGDAPGLLPKIQAAATRDPNSALVLIHPPASAASPGAGRQHDDEEAKALGALGVAVLRGSVERVDPQAGLLLTRDERVLLFDSLTVQWGARRDLAGVEAAVAVAEQEDEHEHERQQQQHLGASRRGEVLVSTSASASAAASKAMQYGNKGTGSSSGCNRGCSSIVRRKSLHAGEGLHHIVASWRLSNTDTWPWVWLVRNEAAPLHMVVAGGREALAAADDRLADCGGASKGGAGSSGCNVLVVGRPRDGVAAAEFDRRGCARIEAEVEALDAAHCIVMLDDGKFLSDALGIGHTA